MDAVHRPPPSPLIFSSFISSHPTQPRRKLQFLTKQKHRRSHRQLRTRALNDAIATTSSAGPPGDVSVLIPISAVLLFVYWITNFVVPNMVIKDLQSKDSDREETPEPQGNTSGTKKASKGSEPRQKIKKRTAKKMTTP